MQLDLYTTGVPEATLSTWVSRVSAIAAAENIQVIQSDITETDVIPGGETSVISDELSATPNRCISFVGSNEMALQMFAGKNYQSRFQQGWRVCLYFPDKNGVLLHFDENLLARRAAHFHYREGVSDKVYQLYLAYALTLDFYSVISRHGRRGKTLQQTEKSFDYRLNEAEQEWNRLYDEKIRKGYKVGLPALPNQLELDLF